MQARTRRIVEVVALSAVVGGLAYQGYQDQARRARPVVVSSFVTPMRAPAFSLPDYLGRERIRLSSYEGKVVLINFYEATCQHCRDEIPDFNLLYERLRPRGFEIIGISLHRGDRRSVERLAAELEVRYALALGDPDVVKRYGGLEGTPTSFLVDRQGRIVKVFPGSVDRMTLWRAVQPLL